MYDKLQQFRDQVSRAGFNNIGDIDKKPSLAIANQDKAVTSMDPCKLGTDEYGPVYWQDL